MVTHVDKAWQPSEAKNNALAAYNENEFDTPDLKSLLILMYVFFVCLCNSGQGATEHGHSTLCLHHLSGQEHAVCFSSGMSGVENERGRYFPWPSCPSVG